MVFLPTLARNFFVVVRHLLHCLLRRRLYVQHFDLVVAINVIILTIVVINAALLPQLLLRMQDFPINLYRALR